MLAIKLKRIGKKHQASFRIIVSEKRSKIDGRYVEDLGWLNPRSDELNVNKERAEYWLKNGAQPTDTVYNLLVKIGLIKGPKRAVHAKSKNEAPTQSVAEEKPQTAPEEKEELTPEEKPKEEPKEKIAEEIVAEIPAPTDQAEQPSDLTENE